MHAVWQADLKHLPFPKSNYNKHFILFCVDVLSKQLFVQPIKTKSADNVLEAFKVIFDRAKVTPDSIETDSGTEFFNRKLKQFFDKKNVNHFKRSTPIKAANVERVIRTMFNIISRYLTQHNSKRFVHKLQDFVDIYQNTYHRSIKTTPA